MEGLFPGGWDRASLREIYRRYIRPPRRSPRAERAFLRQVRETERTFIVQIGLLTLLVVTVLFPTDYWMYEGDVLRAFVRWRLFVIGVVSLGVAGLWFVPVLRRYGPEWSYGMAGIAVVGVTYYLGGIDVDLNTSWQKPVFFTWSYILPFITAFWISADLPRRLAANVYLVACACLGFFVLNPANANPDYVTAVLLVHGGAIVVAMLGGHLIHNLFRRAHFLNRDLQEEQERSEELLLNILPGSVANRLKESNRLIADGFEETTVLFADIVEFTPVAEELEPSTVVLLLDDMFSALDRLIRDYPVEKIKTVGDEYFVASGVPDPLEDHARVAAELALEMRRVVGTYRREKGRRFEVRMGMNSGPVVAGVIGMDKFVYDVWGDTVNVGSRMETQGEAGRIQVTKETRDAIRAQSEPGSFTFERRGDLAVKGKGTMTTYFLEPG